MKKNKKIQLKTKHLCISPKTLEELKTGIGKRNRPGNAKSIWGYDSGCRRTAGRLALVYRLDDNLKRDRDLKKKNRRLPSQAF